MADDHSVDQPVSSNPSESSGDVSAACVPCRHLRNKGMFVYNGGAGDSSYEDSENTIYWCVKTMKGFGPDDEMVSRDDCTIADRTCYEPF